MAPSQLSMWIIAVGVVPARLGHFAAADSICRDNVCVSHEDEMDEIRPAETSHALLQVSKPGRGRNKVQLTGNLEQAHEVDSTRGASRPAESHHKVERAHGRAAPAEGERH